MAAMVAPNPAPAAGSTQNATQEKLKDPAPKDGAVTNRTTRTAQKPTSAESDPSGALERGLFWAVQAIGMAAAVVFGVWAPLAYKATVDGNSGNDASSSSMLSALLSASSEASVAAATQSAMLDAVNSRLDAMGQLWLVDVCRSLTVCSQTGFCVGAGVADFC